MTVTALAPNPGSYNYGMTQVGESVTQIAQLMSCGQAGVLVYNAGADTIYLGDNGVTASTGFPVAASATQLVPTVGGVVNQLYAIAATGTNDVYVLFASGS